MDITPVRPYQGHDQSKTSVRELKHGGVDPEDRQKQDPEKQNNDEDAHQKQHEQNEQSARHGQSMRSGKFSEEDFLFLTQDRRARPRVKTSLKKPSPANQYKNTLESIKRTRHPDLEDDTDITV